ncbi:MAG: hypothetical protein HUU15_09480 [Candidatus Brocadiae bacterium]|nr:hypothetical protein [Candidatus Brocadiia bacterium]
MASRPRDLLRMIAVFVFIASAAGAVIWYVASYQSEARRRFFAETDETWIGRIAWQGGAGIRWTDFPRLATGGDPLEIAWDADVERVLWSNDGASLYVVDDTARLGSVHRIWSCEIATGKKTLLLDLGAEKLEDDDLDTHEVWVIAVGDAESDRERVIFRLSTGDWYSVDSLRRRVRREAGRPADGRAAHLCPEAGAGLERKKSDDDGDDGILMFRQRGDSHRVTTDSAEDPGALWMQRKPGR